MTPHIQHLVCPYCDKVSRVSADKLALYFYSLTYAGMGAIVE
ncbi:MAG: hypothetical protein RIK85_13270 [Marinobacter sp.]